MTRRLPSAKRRARRSVVEVVEERTVATTVVFGRWRMVLVRPRPIPLFAPVIRYVIVEDISDCFRWF